MLHPAQGFAGAVTAPHRAATLAGYDILKSGGTAIEAMVAAAATIAVTYPHMNAIGGDGFWLIHRPGQPVVGISACGPAAGRATPEFYAEAGHTSALPTRGPLAALTVPGTIGGWQKALDLVPEARRLPLAMLLADAIDRAHDGFAVTGNQARTTREKLAELQTVPGFADTFLVAGKAPDTGHRLRQPALAATLEALARDGLDSFYRGDIAKTHADFLAAVGSPLRAADLAAYGAEYITPLRLETSWGTLFNMTPPTQGVASLMILGLFDRLGVEKGESFAHHHGLIEAVKAAFTLRNEGLGDPRFMAEPAQDWLAGDRLDRLAAGIDPETARPWPDPAVPGDTIWMGAADRFGNVVSFIQSIFFEFGSGLVCPHTGVLFQNRGAGFSLAAGPNGLAPGKTPFHTLNPAMAHLKDERVLAYGTMGGEGQPQTQAQIFTRHVQFGMDLQQAVTAPRWVLGRLWGAHSTSLKLESRFDPDLVAALGRACHPVEMIDAFSDSAGHAGALSLAPDGLLTAATDPRADGIALAG